MSGQLVMRVLFVSDGNSASSIMAEAILNRTGGGRFLAQSAGINPCGAVEPHVLSLLREEGHDVSRLHPKSVADIAAAGPFDFVIALRSRVPAAWHRLPGRPAILHWDIPYAAAANDPPSFEQAYMRLTELIGKFVALPPAPMTGVERKRAA
jgi:protein-tyrosine-phosphatase